LISVIVVFLSSCSNDTEEVSKNFIKIIETTENGVSQQSAFTYVDNKIISSDNSKENISYTYNEGLITKIVSYDKLSQITLTLDYTYLKGKLIKITSSDKEVTYYTYNSDGTVFYEKYKLNSQDQEELLYHGTLFFENKNLVKDERIFDDTNGVDSSATTSFEYDSFKNPYFSILGYDKLLDKGAVISKNNVVITVAQTSTVVAGQTISSANLYRNDFKYDVDDYPTEQVSEAGISNPNYLKIEYLY
ncbi:MAG TPA: hypothetical protein VJ780_05085, partial [Flavobacterium sp.]|nr:hypothetical protein [Flavobacterium sp.]